MGFPPLSQIERRRIEAEILVHVYATLLQVHDRNTALHLVTASVEAAAYAAGRAFAASTGAALQNLDHFATVLDVWQASGALDVQNIDRSGGTLSFEVVRCEYATMYRNMGLPPELAAILSCCRDAPFARGYSPCLVLHRPSTIAEGESSCRFTFVWRVDGNRVEGEDDA